MKQRENPIELAQEQLQTCDETIKRLTEKINKAFEVLLKHLTTIEKKNPLFEQYRILITKGDFNSARDLWEQKLNISIRRKENKVIQIEEMLEELKRLKDLQAQVKKDILAVLTFLSFEEQKSRIKTEGFFKVAEPEEWKNHLNSKFKVFQDLFSPIEARILPNQNEVILDLTQCIVDPEKIPTTFLEVLELNNNSNESSLLCLPIQKEKAIPKLKKLFSKAENMSLEGSRNARYDNFRLLIIQGTKKQNGKIIYTRYTGEKPSYLDTKILTVYTSAYDALRKIAHQRFSSAKENRNLQEVLISLQSINALLGAIEEQDSQNFKESIRNDATEKLNMEIKKLQACTNYLKTEARSILALIVEIKDSRGQINPPAIRARIIRIQNLLKKRILEKKRKADYLSGDEAVLTNTIFEGESLLEEYMKKYQTLEKHVKIARNASLFNQEKALDKERQIQNFLTLIQRILGENEFNPLEKLKVRPFNFFAQALQKVNQAILEAIQKTDYQSLVLKTEEALKICQLFEEKQKLNILLEFFGQEQINLSLRVLANNLLKLTRFPITQKEKPQIEEFIKRLVNNPDGIMREKLLQEIKKFLKEISLEIDSLLDPQ